MEDRPVHITVRFFSYLREYGKSPDGVVRLALPQGTHVKDIFNCLKLKNDEVSLVMINHHRANLEDIVHNGDFVEVFPIVGGG